MAFVYQVIIAIVLALVSAALAPKPQGPVAATEDELGIPNAKAGKPLAVYFGRNLIKSPTWVHYGDLNVKPVKVSSGK